MKNLRVTRNYFLIEVPPLEKEKKEDTLILGEKDSIFFEVLLVGPDVKEISVGDNVLISQNVMPTLISIDGKLYSLFRETDVLCIKNK